MTMGKQSKQEMFDTVSLGLARQGGPARNKNGLCVYRGPDGRKCALGHLIADDEYQIDMEEKGVAGLVKTGLLPVRLMGHEAFLYDLQQAHDHAVYNDFDRTWREPFGFDGIAANFRDFAGRYRLNPAAVRAFQPAAV